MLQVFNSAQDPQKFIRILRISEPRSRDKTVKQSLIFQLRDTNLRMFSIRHELSVGPEERRPGENSVHGVGREQVPTGMQKQLEKSVLQVLAPGPLCAFSF